MVLAMACWQHLWRLRLVSGYLFHHKYSPFEQKEVQISFIVFGHAIENSMKFDGAICFEDKCLY